MFSDSGAPAPGERRGLKPRGPHFIPWLRNSLKPRRGGDPGLDTPAGKSGSEVRNNNLTRLERAKGIGLFSVQGNKDRAKKGGELRCNGAGMARMLPAVVLKGHHILPGSLGKQRKDSPPGWNLKSPELQPDADTQVSPGDRPRGLTNSPASAQDNHTFVGNHSSHELNLPQSQSDGTSTLIRKYGPLVGPPPAPVPDEANCKASVLVAMACDYGSSATLRQRDLHLSKWLNSDTRGLTERKHGFTSSFSYVKHKSRISQGHRDPPALRSQPPVEGFNGPLNNGVILSTEAPRTGRGHSTITLRGSGDPRPSLEGIETLGQNQTSRVRRSRTDGGGPQREEAGGCTRKVVRNQIKRVVDNLEQVLRALRDVHQEMKEVVHQIDHLTASIELNEEDQWTTTGGDNTAAPVGDNGSGSDPCSSGEAAVVGARRRRVKPEDRPGTTHSSGTLGRDHQNRRQSPPNVLLYPLTPRLPSERTRNTQYTTDLPLQRSTNLTSRNPPQLQNPTSHDRTLSPRRSLPVRPPTPGLSPLTVNLHPANSPTSQPHSPAWPSSSIKVSPPSPVSPKPQPAPTFSSSVVTENEIGSYHQTPQSDHPSAGQSSPSSTRPPSASRPPTDTDTETQTVSSIDGVWRASSAGPVPGPSRVSAVPAAAAKPPTEQGRRGRKPPPPYPHDKPPEHARKVTEPRKAPPYPEKRRPLSTTV